MISRMAVGETPSPSLDCLNFFMAIDFPRFVGDLIRARKTRPYVPSPIFPIRSYCRSHSGLLLLERLPSPMVDLLCSSFSFCFFRSKTKTHTTTKRKLKALFGCPIRIINCSCINKVHLIFSFKHIIIIT